MVSNPIKRRGEQSSQSLYLITRITHAVRICLFDSSNNRGRGPYLIWRALRCHEILNGLTQEWSTFHPSINAGDFTVVGCRNNNCLGIGEIIFMTSLCVCNLFSSISQKIALILLFARSSTFQHS